MRARKLILVVLISMVTLIFISCGGNNDTQESPQTQETSYEDCKIEYRVYKENPVSQVVIEGETDTLQMMDVLLRMPKSIDDLIRESYSIVIAELTGVMRDESIYSVRYYDFDINQCIKGDMDELSKINIRIDDYAFGESSTFIVNKDDGYIPPYELGASYLLFIGKSQYVYDKKDKIEYYLDMNAFSKLNGENIISLMQQACKQEGAYPATIGKLKEKVSELVEEPKDNGLASGNDFIESENIPEIIDFAPVIVEVKKKSKMEDDPGMLVDIYELELMDIHKGEVPDSLFIRANAKNGIDDAEEFLLFLSPPANGSGTYMLASPQGSVIPLSDAERYSQAIKYIYPEDNGRFWDKVKSFFTGLFDG